MDFNEYDFQNFSNTNPTPPKNKRSVQLAMASVVLGISSLMTSGCLYLSIVCGALGILFALLSRGGEMKLDTTGKVGLILSVAGLILTAVIYISAFAFLLDTYGSIDGIVEEYMRLYNMDSLDMFNGGRTI